MTTWRNAGLPWWRRDWEAAYRDKHFYGYTEKSVTRKFKRAVKKRIKKVKKMSQK